jgi:putative transposase
MAYVKNWFHCVWGTNNRQPFLRTEERETVIKHILENAKDKKIWIDCLNGSSEHLHCLLSLDPDKSLSQVMQLIKGESSHWINKQKLTTFRFKWAVEYFALSVSESQLTIIRNYIRNQEEHHKKMSWEGEYNKFLKDYGFERYTR